MRAGPCLLVVLSGFLFLAAASGTRAGEAERLADVLRIDEVIEVLRDEGLEFGADLDRDMLGGQGGAFWSGQVDRIYAKDKMEGAVRKAISDGMSAQQIDETIAFFDTELGQRILGLETSARRAIADPEVEEIARDTYASLKGSGDSRLAAINRFIEVNDLVERNVSGALNASFYFMRGLSEGGASDMSDADITAEVWAQEEETRTDTEGWLYGFLLLAYRPLGDDELEAYIVYSGTPAGQALNSALFSGFDGMYLEISHTLGVLVAEASASSEL